MLNNKMPNNKMPNDTMPNNKIPNNKMPNDKKRNFDTTELTHLRDGMTVMYMFLSLSFSPV
jgi:hypothetical protein